jgi:protein-S-isoprenylcysteine O-methyltransferase Ste14
LGGRSGIFIIWDELVLAFRSCGLFLRNRTTLSPYESRSILISIGPFRISRNPVFLVIIEILFILDEERRLEENFWREDYRDYVWWVRWLV